MGRRGCGIAIIAVLMVLLLLPPARFMGALIAAYVNAEVQRAITAVTPDTFFDVAITVRNGGRERRETVKVACVSVTDGFSLYVYRTRRAFPEFTVIPSEEGAALVIPVASVCDRPTLRNASMLTDSAVAPTWVASPDSMGVDVELVATPAPVSHDNERAVRDHYRRLRDATTWGAIMGTVDGQSVNISQRVSGNEFERVERTEFDNRIDDIPAGAVEDRCVAYGPRDSETFRFRSCVHAVWHAQGPRNVPEDLSQFCEGFHVARQCTLANPSDCSPDERLYRRTAEEEFSTRIGRSNTSSFQVRGCYGVLGTEEGFSLLTLESPGLFVELEPDDLKSRGRISRYLRD